MAPTALILRVQRYALFLNLPNYLPIFLQKNNVLNRKFCDYIVVCSGVIVEINNVMPMFLSLYTERRLIGLRPPSDRIAFAV